MGMIQTLEDRIAPAIITWANPAGGAWGTAANWDLNRVPAANDDVVIPDLAGSQTITVSTTTTVASVTAQESLSFTGGTFTSASTNVANANVTLVGATLAGGVWTVTGGSMRGTNSGGTLNGITLNGTLDSSTSNTVVNIANGLVLNGSINLVTAGTRLEFSGTQSLTTTSTGTVFFGNVDGATLRILTAASTLTIGSGVTLRGGTSAGSTLVGYNASWGGPTNVSIVNQGTISADVSGTSITIQGNPLTNAGTLEAKNGGTLNLSSMGVSSGAISALAGSTVFIDGNWSNTGTITESNGTLNLGGTFNTAALGTVVRSGGTVYLSGTWNNTAATLNLPATLNGPLAILGGTLSGGTVNGSLVGTRNGGTLSGITLNGTLDFNLITSSVVNIANGLVLNGSINLATAGARLEFSGTQSLTTTSTGTVFFGNVDGATLRILTAASTLTIGSSVTLRGGTSAGSTLVGYNASWGGPTNVSIVNQGTISADVAGTSITIQGNPLTNAGTLEAKNGGTLNLSSMGVSSGSISALTGSTVFIDGNWSNTGTITESNGTLNLGGTFNAAALGTVVRSGGTVYLSGTWNNTAATLNLPATLNGPLAILGGTLSGGTVNGSLVGTRNGGTLSGITLNGTLDFNLITSSVVNIANGLVLNGSINLATAGARLEFSGTQSLTTTSTGTVFFGNVDGATLRILTAASTLTIGSSVTLRGGTSAGSTLVGYNASWGGPTNVSIVNQGTISADVAGTSITIQGNPLTNAGTLEAKNGGTLNLSSMGVSSGSISALTGSTVFIDGNWSNTGTITESNGTLNLGGTFNAAALGTVVRTGGTVYLSGTWNNTAATLNLSATLNGPLTILGGTLSGGTVNGSLVGTRNGGTLSGITLNGTLDFNLITSSVVNISNGLVLNGSINLVTAGSRLEFSGTQSLTTTSTGTVFFGNVDGATLRILTAASTLTIGSGVTLRGGTSAGSTLVGYNASWGGPTNVSIVNQGTISADVAGTSITIQGNPLTNAGTLEAKNGGTLNLTAGISNSGSIVVSAGAMNIQGTSTWSSTGQLIHTGGAINVTGTINNTGNIETSANLNLTGTIAGGTLRTSGTGRFVLNGGTINSVVLAGVAEVQSNSIARGGLILNGGQLIVDAGKKLAFQGGNQTLTGDGTVAFAGTGGSLEVEANRQLIIAAGVTIVGTTGTNSLVASASGASGVNYATRSVAAGASVSLVGNWVDHGHLLTPNPANADGGRLTRNVPTPGNIAVAGQTDNWTLFGFAGQGMSFFLNPTNGAGSSLGLAQLQVLNSANELIATVTGTAVGQTLKIVDFAFPSNDLYTLRVKSAPSQANGTGNYLLTAYEATTDTQPLILGQQAHGYLETYYSIDRWTFATTANQQVNLRVIGVASQSIRFKLSGPNGFVGFSNLNTSSGPLFLPTSGDYTIEVDGNQTGFGAYALQLDATTQTPLTLNSNYTGTLSGEGFTQVFRLDVGQTNPVVLHFDDVNSTDRTEIYARFGAPPTRRTYDARFEETGADHTVSIPVATAGVWYVMVYGDYVPTSSSFTLLAESVPVAVRHVAPNFGGVNENLNLTITGQGFMPGTLVDLIPAAGGPSISAQHVSIDSISQLTATVDLAAAPLGVYNVRVTLPNGSFNTLPGGYQVTELGVGNLELNLILPPTLGRHAPATLFVEYSNTGNAPMAAPILSFESADADGSDRPILTLDHSGFAQSFWTSATPPGFSNGVQFTAQGVVPGTIQPGETIRVPVYYAGLMTPWDMRDDSIEFQVSTTSPNDTSSITWAGNLRDELQPDWIPDDAWAAVYANLQDQIGTQWNDYSQMLSFNSAYLKQLGEDVSNVSDLFGFELQQAIGLDPVGTLASAMDAIVPTTGLPLSFGRSFGNTITDRYSIGPFGRGWNASWQVSLETLDDGTLIVHESANSMRRFQPDSRHVGTYFSQVGDTGVMRAVSGGYELTETSGLKTRFLSDGKLNYVRDINGNQITAGFTGNRLTSLSHSDGGSITLTYNAAGLINSVVDSTGRVTTYAYDPDNSHLLSVTGVDGTTNYTYGKNLGIQREHALLSVNHNSGSNGAPGVTSHFEYDTHGRLIASYLEDHVEQVNFAYDATGIVTITDAAGTTGKLYFDHRGLILRTEDGAGNYVVNKYNSDRQLIASTDSLGRVTSFTRCDCGRPKTITDPYGRTILTFTLGGPNNAPTAFTDANGNVTRYSYDAVGNTTRTTYPDNTFEQATYDAHGNLDVTTNRRGQTVDRTVNSNGQVTHEAWSDGTTVDYVYDARGRLHTATDGHGTTTLTFDNADRLTRVDYPAGRWIQYTYDPSTGQRTQILDHTGFATNYEYDNAGRLKTLLDASKTLIVEYSYDAAGRLSREVKGNGTYTEYAYDSLGRQTSIFNYAPNGSVNSKFLYTYDAAGRKNTQTTIDGVWSYSYDLIDQLTHATFVSSNVAIPNQDLTYEYDALGNRTRTILNGTTTSYVANNMNQYTSAGGTTFVYDTDGNLIQENGPEGLKQYTYNQLNRLTRVQTPQGIWNYEYDVLGNRTAVVKDGVRTEFLIDPTGLGDVVGEYDGAGAHTTSYVHGIGLESSIGVTGVGYYDFDNLGSTSGVSASSGLYINRYSYDPWGDTLVNNETAANPFEYVGEFGVMTEGNGLHFMRVRFFSQSLGSFTSADPLRISGRDENLYRYVHNSPVDRIDPRGLMDQLAKCENKVIGYSSAVGAAAGALIGVFCGPGAPGCTVAGAGVGAGTFVPVGIELSELCDPHLGKSGLLASPLQDNFRNDCNPRMNLYDDYPSPCGLPLSARPPDPSFTPAPKPPKSQSLLTDEDVSAARDPNEKFGAAGFGTAAFIGESTEIPYRINFENLGPGSVPAPTTPASAPAQRVEVTDPLSTNLDWDTFQFTDFGFGDELHAVPLGRSHYFATIGITYNNTFFNVEVELNFDRATGIVSAIFQSLDPATSLPPDVLTGFLPPEDGTGIGKAHVAFTIKPKAGLASGTELRNVANIRFDGQTIIPTNQIDPQDPTSGTSPAKEALNTIDAGGPTSSVSALPATSLPSFTVTWSGSDESGGSGIGTYDVFVSDNGAAFIPLLVGATLTSTTFVGTPAHSYAFYSIATDNVGHRETTPISADTTTTIAILNHPPTNLTLSASSVAENLPSGTSVGTFSTSDPDAGNTFTYTLIAVSGNSDDTSFNIAGDTLKTAAIFDFETKNSYSIRVRTTDQNGLWFEKDFTIQITDLTEDVTNPVSSVTGAVFNTSNGLFVVSVQFTDPAGALGVAASGVQFIDVYYRVNPNSAGSVRQLFGRIVVNPVAASGTATISAALNAQPGDVIQLWSVATDAAGNIEAEVTPRTDYSFAIADTVGPTTRVNTAVFDGSGFINLTFSGTDIGGGNIASVDVYVEKDPGSVGSSITRIGTVAGGTNSMTGSLRFALPHDGISHSYRFFSIGTDHIGNREGGSGALSGDPGPGADIVLNNILVSVPVVAAITNFDVNAGLENRSSVQTADLLFNDQAFIEDLLFSLNDGNTANDRIRLERLDLAGNRIGSGQFVPVTATRDGLKLTLNFGALGLQQNGVYAVRIDMDGNLSNGFESSRRFHRLLGDVTGDGKVDVADSNKTRAAYANPALFRDGDVDGDGDVDANDINFFTKFLRGTTGDKQLQLFRNSLDD